MKSILFGVVILMVLIACQSQNQQTEKMEEPVGEQFSIEEKTYGRLSDTVEVIQYTITSASGFEMRILNYGCIMTHLLVPDRDGNLEDILLGFDNWESYEENSPFFGCIVGRYGNRIAKGKFSIDDKEYTLALNNGENHLHGGEMGFDKKMWKSSPYVEGDRAGVRFEYTSKDGEEGYPGNLMVRFNCYITAEQELGFEYEAETDQITHCNLTQHNYYNLSGNTKRNILGHALQIDANHITPVDKGLIPTGELLNVRSTPFDFTDAKPIERDIDKSAEQLKFAGGYDHNFVLSDSNSDLHDCAILIDSVSGRKMEVKTTEPGVQFYSGNFLDGSFSGKYGIPYTRNMGMCLETQHFPDSPNQKDFPSTILRPGETYSSKTIHKFSVLP